MIPCLRSNDVVLFCCSVEGDELIARWVQQNPAKLDTLPGSTQLVVEPKKPDGQRYQITIPDGLEPVTTDVRFPIVNSPALSVDR